MTLTLTRVNNYPDCTIGMIKIGEKSFFTLELAFHDNISNISCIPAGIYQCTYTLSPHFNKKTYLLTGVKDRTSIRIHSSNVAHELKGCIALGRTLGILNGSRAVLSSRQAVEEFEKLLDFKPFQLEILDAEIPVQVS